MPSVPATAPSDEELACRAQGGCVASFEELARRFQGPLLHFLRNLGAGADAEDLLQDTLVRAYTNLHRYDSRWRIATWLFTIARRLWLNHRRRPDRCSGSGPLETFSSRGREPSQAVADEEDRQRLWGVAARVLSEDEQAALWLFYVEEMTGREIAAVLNRSWAGVKTLLFRARRRMLAALREAEPGRAPPRPATQDAAPPLRQRPANSGTPPTR
jgi:RNA polymerase sigma-70 factor (ECF subfamily)